MQTQVLMDSNQEQPKPKTISSQKGRKKKATESTQKVKRQAQRGMGVAKLEAQRQQTELSQYLKATPNQYYVPCTYPGILGQLGFNNQGGMGLVSPICGPGSGFGYYTGSGYGLGSASLGPKGETSRELASIPNFNQFSENWGVSNKKKRVSEESLGCNGMKDVFGIESQINGSGIFGFNPDKNQFFEGRREKDRVKSPSLASYIGGNMDQESEAVAVHIKGYSSPLKEYEFFPGYNTYNKNNTDPKVDYDTLSHSLNPTTTTSTTSMGSVIYHPKPIDLSLKLSY